MYIRAESTGKCNNPCPQNETGISGSDSLQNHLRGRYHKHVLFLVIGLKVCRERKILGVISRILFLFGLERGTSDVLEL